MHGLALLALCQETKLSIKDETENSISIIRYRWNVARTDSSLAPINLESNSGPCIELQR